MNAHFRRSCKRVVRRGLKVERSNSIDRSIDRTPISVTHSPEDGIGRGGESVVRFAPIILCNAHFSLSGCVKLMPVARGRGSQEAGSTQPLTDKIALLSTGRVRFGCSATHVAKSYSTQQKGCEIPRPGSLWLQGRVHAT